jgi:hypothetical protein
MKHWDLYIYIYVVVFCGRGLGRVPRSESVKKSSSLQLSVVTRRFLDGFRTRDQTLDLAAEAERTADR